jgi:hypothetical protein
MEVLELLPQLHWKVMLQVFLETPDLNVGIVTGVSFVGSGTALTGVSVGSTDYVTGIAITMGTGTFTGNVSIGGNHLY